MENYTFDEQGKEILESKSIWKYENNRLSEVQHYNAKNKLTDTNCYTYDQAGNLTEITVKTAKGSKKQSVIHEYQDNKLVQVTDNTRGYKIVSKFDDHGNPTEVQNYKDADSLPFITFYKNLYENDRLVVKQAVFPSGDSDWIDKYRYNAAGQLIEEEQMRHGVVSITKYTYNDKGDLVLNEYNPGEPNHESIKKDIVYTENGDIVEAKEYRMGWCYQYFNDSYGLTGVTRYHYIR
jgi:hypothetical protein